MPEHPQAGMAIPHWKVIPSICTWHWVRCRRSGQSPQTCLHLCVQPLAQCALGLRQHVVALWCRERSGWRAVFPQAMVKATQPTCHDAPGLQQERRSKPCGAGSRGACTGHLRRTNDAERVCASPKLDAQTSRLAFRASMSSSM